MGDQGLTKVSTCYTYDFKTYMPVRQYKIQHFFEKIRYRVRPEQMSEGIEWNSIRKPWNLTGYRTGKHLMFYLKESVYSNLSVHEICSHFGVGQTSPAKKFREETNQGIMEYFMNPLFGNGKMRYNTFIRKNRFGRKYMKKILFAASEGVPFIKTGGLADVIGSLPKCLDSSEYDVRVVLPKYTCMKSQMKEKMENITSFYMDFNRQNVYVGVQTAQAGGITCYFIDNESYFSGFKPYSDNGIFEIEKYAFFSKAVLAAMPEIGFVPDVIHCHDWQTGLIPVFLDHYYKDNAFYGDTRTVMTIHNLKFQGRWSLDAVQSITGLPWEYFTFDKLESYGEANLLKGGITYADAITTVSRTYAEEIKTGFYGEGLDALLRYRSDRLQGIVNGIDCEEFNPATDANLAFPYDISSFREKKKKNKLALQKELGLKQDENRMMIGLVSRLTSQKGLDLIAHVMEEICQDDIQFVILGTGEEKYENLFRHYDGKYAEKVSANIYFSEALSHKIYGSCDAFLMPSLFEPCGLSQLMSLRYGTLPIVRETGGLKDTVEPYNEYEGSGTGFSFTNYNAHDMLNTIRYAIRVYYEHKEEWDKMTERAMKADFSWNASALKYQEIYDRLIG